MANQNHNPTDLARETHLSPKSTWYWLENKRFPASEEQREQLAQYCGLTFDAMLLPPAEGELQFSIAYPEDTDFAPIKQAIRLIPGLGEAEKEILCRIAAAMRSLGEDQNQLARLSRKVFKLFPADKVSKSPRGQKQ